MRTKLYTRLTMVFATILMFTYFATAQTTISVQIIDGADDAEESLDPEEGNPIGTVGITSTDLELCTEATDFRQLVGMIFRDVQIPAGATITNAYVQFQADDDNDQEVTVDIYGAKEANVVDAFTGTVLFEISSHPKTTATVAWTPAIWTPDMANKGAAGVEQQTPDISTIIAEIIALDGWASGNNILIMISDDDNLVKAHREPESFDGDPTGAPILNVTFTGGGGGTAVNTVNAELSNSIYPNPAEGILYVENPSTDKFSYEIYSINGKLVASRHNISGTTTEVDLSNFAKGVYFVDVRSSERTETHKLIVK